MAQAAKAIRRSRSTRKTTQLPKIETMAQLVAALDGAGNIAAYMATETCILQWFERGHVARGYGLQILVSLMHRGYALDRISSELFGHPTWKSYTVPPPKRARRR